jgi:hypothetical protein
MLQLATPVKPPFLIKIKQDLERHRLRRSAAQYLSQYQQDLLITLENQQVYRPLCPC